MIKTEAEVLDDLFKKRDDYIKKKKKKARMTVYISSAVCCCLLTFNAVFGFINRNGAVKSGSENEKNSFKNENVIDGAPEIAEPSAEPSNKPSNDKDGDTTEVSESEYD